MQTNIDLLINRFVFSFHSEETFNSYFIREKNTCELISKELVLTLNIFAKEVHVSRFYPELEKLPQSRYLSAAAFFLIVTHFVQEKHLGSEYGISLNSKTDVFNNFYNKLYDFDFMDTGKALGPIVSAWSHFKGVEFDTLGLLSEESVVKKEYIYI